MSEKTQDVFISYSTKDSDLAFSLLKRLEENGLKCWIAPRDIPNGAQWADEIDKAIQDARVFVVIVSGNSIASRQVPKEISLAVTACETIFPFQIEQVSLQGSFRYFLSDYQFTDATSDTDGKMTELAEGICRFLGKPVSKTPAEAPAKEPTASTGRAGSVEAKSTKQGGIKKPVLFGGIAAAIVLMIVIGIILGTGGKKNASESAASSEVTQTETAEAKPVEESSTVTEASEVPEESVASEDSEQETVEESNPQNIIAACPLYGHWEKIAYEDKEGATDFKTSDLFIQADGEIYSSAEAEARPVVTVADETAAGLEGFWIGSEDLDAYTLTVEYSFKDTFNDEYSDKKTSSTFSGVQDASSFNFSYSTSTGTKALPEENPTGLTFADCYPDTYLYLHITGTYQENPLKSTEIDTWMVYKKVYPYLALSKWPVLAGEWEDSYGDSWVIAEDGTFTMTDASGNTYHGQKIYVTLANAEKVNFFERVSFEFDEYTSDRYAVVSFDGQTLKLLDESWNEMVLTRSSSND